MGDKIKKFSEAIRLGATFRPQCQEAYFITKLDGTITSCAIGAGIEAVTGNAYLAPGWFDKVSVRFGINTPIQNQIVEMNDRQGMTREAIADWLSSQGL